MFEPTGPCHRDLERVLAAAGLPLAKVNPRHARRFAEAIGILAKTDRLDAGLLARQPAGQLRLPLLRRQNARPPARIARDIAAIDAASRR